LRFTPAPPQADAGCRRYFFDHPLSGKEVFWKLANGEIYQQPFTVREGETLFDIAANWKPQNHDGRRFLKAASDPA